jgi:hypothetical protein
MCYYKRRDNNRDQCKKQTKMGKHPIPPILKPSVFGNIEIF